MMPGLLLSPTFWKLIGVAVLAAMIGMFIWHYRTISAEAARVPALTRQVSDLQHQAADNDARASKAALALIAAEAERKQAVEDLGKWTDTKAQIDTTIEEMNRHANASTNPVCAPSAGERQLWNDALAKLTADAGAGQAGTAGQVPASSGGVH